MTDFTPASRDQLFALTHAAGFDQLIESKAYPELNRELLEVLVSAIGEFATNEFAPLNRVGDEQGAKWTNGKVTLPDPFKAAWQEFVKAGWASIDGPSEYGGQGLPYTLSALVLENIGAANFAFGLCPMLSFGAVDALHAHGSEQQKSLYLPKLLSGEWTGTMNLTEPQAGSDVGALTATATPIEEGPHKGKFSIKGQKIFITFGDHNLSENIVHLVLARTPNAPEGTRGISLFLVPKYHLNEKGEPSAPNGVQCLSIEHKLGIHASPTCIMSFGEGEVGVGEMIGQEFGGMRAMFTMMNNARINVGSQGVQIAERATQQAMHYAMERIQSPRAGQTDRAPVAIIEHPDVRRMLLRSQSLTEAIRALLYYSSVQIDLGRHGDKAAALRAQLLTPLVKAYGTDIGCEVASIGLQVHGGMGFIEETGAAQHYRDARIAPIYEGTNGIQAADLVGRKLSLEGGDIARSLLRDIRIEAKEEPALNALCDAIEQIMDWMLSSEASPDDRLAGSYPLLTMFAVATCAMLMARMHRATASALQSNPDDPFLRRKLVTTRLYLNQMVSEATGLQAAARGGADFLYQLNAETITQ